MGLKCGRGMGLNFEEQSETVRGNSQRKTLASLENGHRFELCKVNLWKICKEGKV